MLALSVRDKLLHLIYSDELRTNIRIEVGESKNKLEETSKLTTIALQRANEVYDEALTLFASVNSLTAPEINIEELKIKAAAANKEVISLRNNFFVMFIFIFILS